MNRPDNIVPFDELDLKLGIKSSLPNIRETLALVILIWESLDAPDDVLYSIEEESTIVIADELYGSIYAATEEICISERITFDSLKYQCNKNQLFNSQLEALIVAFELIWKLAKITFTDPQKPASAERTGGVRYAKKLRYSANIDIIHALFLTNRQAYLRVLLSWLGLKVTVDSKCENALLTLLLVLSEDSIYKLSDGDKTILFNQNNIYRKLAETDEPVDINGDKEAKGSLRILKNMLSDGLNPYLEYNHKKIQQVSTDTRALNHYQKRVETLLRLHATKVVNLTEAHTNSEKETQTIEESHRITGGSNILVYGVPGSGKSWTIEHEYCQGADSVERLVFHPDYTYSDFIGQILPDVDDAGLVTYKFVPGPFTSILRDAQANPDKKYILIIEEINRGNAPAIFGEAFQLLDRTPITKVDSGITYPAGTSEYGISNKNIATVVYGDSTRKVRVPSNLSIIGTMNTSDQNVFTLDTAFQRRWEMRLVENSFTSVRRSLAECVILDTGITWETFCSTINALITTTSTSITSSEDKHLGVYFVSENDLECDILVTSSNGFFKESYSPLLVAERENSLTQEQEKQLQRIRESLKKIRRFPEKVIKYLWDDAFKFNREALFDTERFTSLEQVISTFVYSTGADRFKILNPSVFDMLNRA